MHVLDDLKIFSISHSDKLISVVMAMGVKVVFVSYFLSRGIPYLFQKFLLPGTFCVRRSANSKQVPYFKAKYLFPSFFSFNFYGMK